TVALALLTAGRQPPASPTRTLTCRRTPVIQKVAARRAAPPRRWPLHAARHPFCCCPRPAETLPRQSRRPLEIACGGLALTRSPDGRTACWHARAVRTVAVAICSCRCPGPPQRCGLLRRATFSAVSAQRPNPHQGKLLR